MFKIKKDLPNAEPVKRGRGRPPKMPVEITEPQPSRPKRRKLFRRSYLLAVLAIVILAAPSIYFYHKSQVTEKLLKTPDALAKDETAKITKEIGKHIILPTGEQPTLGTVSDINKLKNQPFFDKSQNGDKILIYSKARKVILYRPSVDKIVDITSINTGNSPQATPQ